MSSPARQDDNKQPTRGRMDDVSVNRRGFFREILSLGLDKVDQAGKNVGKRFGDFMENKRENPELPAAPKLQPPAKTQARGQGQGENDE